MGYRDVNRRSKGLPRIMLERKVFLYSMSLARSIWFLIILLILVLRIDLLVEKEFIGLIMQVAIAGAGLSATIAAVIAGLGMELEYRLTISYLIGAAIFSVATMLSAFSYLASELYMYTRIQLVLLIGILLFIDWASAIREDEKRYKRYFLISTIFLIIIIPVATSLTVASLVVFFGGLVFLVTSILVTIYALLRAKSSSDLSPLVTAILEVLRKKLPHPLTREELEKHLLEEKHLSPEPIDLNEALRILELNGHIFKLTISNTTYYTIMPTTTWEDLKEKIAKIISTKMPPTIIIDKVFIEEYLERTYDDDTLGNNRCFTPLLGLLEDLEREIGWKLAVLTRKFSSIDLANYIYEIITQHYMNKGSCYEELNRITSKRLLCSTNDKIDKLLQEVANRIKGLKMIIQEHFKYIVYSTCKDLGINKDVCECSLTYSLAYSFVCDNVLRKNYINGLQIPSLEKQDDKEEIKSYIRDALNRIIELIHNEHRNLQCEPKIEKGEIIEETLSFYTTIRGFIKCRLKRAEDLEDDNDKDILPFTWIRKDYIEPIKDYLKKHRISTLSECL